MELASFFRGPLMYTNGKYNVNVITLIILKNKDNPTVYTIL